MSFSKKRLPLKVVKISPRKKLHVQSLYLALDQRIDEHLAIAPKIVTKAEIVGVLMMLANDRMN